MRPTAFLAAALLAAATFAAPAGAVNPDEMLKDPALEERAREISKDLRCVVCQNQSIDDSDAELARDLRIIVRERLKAGDSNTEVVDYVVARYGDYVLLTPPFKSYTYALWFGPPVLFVIGIVAYFMYFRRRPDEVAEAPPARLTAEEERRLKKLLGDNPPS